MKQSEIKRLQANGATVKMVKSTPVPELPTPVPQEMIVKLESEPQILDIDVKVDVQSLVAQVAALTSLVQDLLSERKQMPSELEVIRNQRGEMTGVKPVYSGRY